MLLSITHETRYAYDKPVQYGLQQIRLTPNSNNLQNVLNWSVEITGASRQVTFVDENENHTITALVSDGVEEVVVRATGEVETHDNNGILGKQYGPAPLWHFRQATALTQPGKGIRALAKTANQSADKLSALHDLSRTILSTAPYTKGQTYTATSAEEALQAGHGVCQDHAQIFIAAARLADLPARYVSGYLMMNDRIDQEASHAWAEVHLPDLGWVGFDVSNGISPDERYVRLATGRDYREAAPISGMRMGSSDETMIVSLQVQQ